MTVQLSIRNVPAAVRDELAARAAGSGRSLQEYLLAELTRLAAKPSPEAWAERVRARKKATRTRLPARAILAMRDMDRR